MRVNELVVMPGCRTAPGIVPQTIDLSQQSVEMLTANAIGELGLVGDIPVTVCPGTVLARVA